MDRNKTEVEKYVAAFAGVKTVEEGRKVREQAIAAGVWCSALIDSAALAWARISSK